MNKFIKKILSSILLLLLLGQQSVFAIGSSATGIGSAIGGIAQLVELPTDAYIKPGANGSGTVRNFGAAGDEIPNGFFTNLSADSITVDGVALKTSADINYYIATTGNDANDCLTTLTACLTRQRVYDLIPDVVAHKVTVNVAAGTYYDAAKLRGHFVSTNGSIVIQGATTTILATQTATGGDNINASGLGEITVAGAGWVVDAYQGYFVKFITSTSPTAKIWIKYAPVISNTADTLTVPALRFTPGANTTFQIVQLTTTISGASAASPNVAVTPYFETITNMQAASSAPDDGLYARYAITYDALNFQNGVISDVYVTEAYVMMSGVHFGSTDPTANANYWAVYAFSSNNYIWLQGIWMDGYKHALVVSQEAAIVTAENVYLDYRNPTKDFTAATWTDAANTLTKVGAFAGLSLHGTFPLYISSGTNMVVESYTATYVSDDAVTLAAGAGSADSADVAFQLGSVAFDDVMQTAAGGSVYLRDSYVRGNATHILTKVVNADGNGSYGDMGRGRVEYATSLMRAGNGGYVNALSNNTIFGANNTNLYTISATGSGRIRPETGAGYTTAYNVDDTSVLWGAGATFLSPDTAINNYAVKDLIHPLTFADYINGAWDDVALTLTRTNAFAGLSGTFPLIITAGTNMVPGTYTATYVSANVVTLVGGAGSANSTDVAFTLTPTIPLGYSTDSLTATAPRTLTATPTIATGIYTGQPMTLIGTSDVNTITVQDANVLAGTTIELLNNNTVILGAGDYVNLKWNVATSKWEEAGNTFMNMLFKGTTGNKNIYLQDNQADTLSFTEATNKYLTFVTTNTSETISTSKTITMGGDNVLLDLSVNSTLYGYQNNYGTINVNRLGAMTGVNGETAIEVNILPQYTLTEPGAGTFIHYGANIDMSSISVTAGGGASDLYALRLVANTDLDSREKLALLTLGVSRSEGQFQIGNFAGAGLIQNPNEALHIASIINGSGIRLTGNDAGATGTAFTCQNKSASPVDGDILCTLNFNGDDSAANDTTYGQITTEIQDPANTPSEESIMRFYVLEAAGNSREYLRFDGTDAITSVIASKRLQLEDDLSFSDISGTSLINTGPANATRSIYFNLDTVGGAADLALDYQFQIDGVTEAGLFSETNGAGGARGGVWKIPYITGDFTTAVPWDNVSFPAPTSLANGSMFSAFNTDGATSRLYIYSNGAWVSTNLL